MKKDLIKKCMAGALALCICGGVTGLSSIVSVNDNLSVYAAIEEEPKIYENEVFQYHRFDDHIELHHLSAMYEETIVEIPSKIDGLPVTVIGDFCFNSKEKLTSVTIPSGVTVIKEFAFYGCKGLTSVTIPDSVTEVGEVAFTQCESLEKVVMSKNLKTLGNNAFRDCYKLKEITIPTTLSELPYGTFHRCTSLENIVLPKNIGSIGNFALGDCTNLKSVTIENPACEIYNSQLCINNSTEKISDIKYSGVICAVSGSKAEEYANRYGYKFKAIGGSSSKPTPSEPTKPTVPAVTNATFGDVNGDESIDSSDASLVLVEYSSLSTGGGSLFTKSMTAAADVNKDETVDSSDASLILAYYAYVSTTANAETNMEKWLANK